MTDYKELFLEAEEQLPRGAFLIAGNNVMTIGWCQFGIIWGKPVCTVFVRHSRYTHKILEKENTFTVSVPSYGEMAEQLAFCSQHSGRDCDKFADSGLQQLPSLSGAPGGILGCALHFECRIVSSCEMDPNQTDSSILSRYYGPEQSGPDGDLHTLYFGEIVASFRGK